MQVNPVELQPIVQTTANSLGLISDQGILGAVTVLAFVVAGMCLWILLKQAKDCAENTKVALDKVTTALNNNTDMIGQFKDSNKDALHGVQISIAKLETKLDA